MGRFGGEMQYQPIVFVGRYVFVSNENITAHAKMDEERIYAEGEYDVFSAPFNGRYNLPDNVLFEKSRLRGRERPLPE